MTLESTEEVAERLGELPDFERFLADLHEQVGWMTEVTQQSRDGGYDINARRSYTDRLIEAKQWEDPVRVGVVRESLGVIEQEHADEMWLVTTSEFTADARSAVEDTDLRLLNGTELASHVLDWTHPEFVEEYFDSPVRPGCEVPAATSIQNATRIIHFWADSDLPGDWGGVRDVVEQSSLWEVVVEMVEESERHQHRVTIDKHSGKIQGYQFTTEQ